MSASPKREMDGDESPEDKASQLSTASKKLCLNRSHDNGASGHVASAPLSDAPDSRIDQKAAIAYWSSTEPTVNGVLQGYPQVSRIDLQGSRNFLARIRRQSKSFPPSKKLGRVVDCGAGIGRVTDGLLSKVAETVDVVEPVENFTDKIQGDHVGKIHNVGLEAWRPEVDGRGPYDLIWNQWCIGQLTDVQTVEYLQKLPPVLSEGGWIVVKENVTAQYADEDVYDETDSSVTRTDKKFRTLFEQARLKIVSTELQKGLPAGLYPVRTFALQPK